MSARGDIRAAIAEARREANDAASRGLHAGYHDGRTDGLARALELLGPEPSAQAAANEKLQAAIRTFTVEAPNDEPNGAAEGALLAIGVAIRGEGAWARASEGERLRDAREFFNNLCEALADDTKALREASEAYFGGDFRKPKEGP